MQKKCRKQHHSSLSYLFCIALIVAMALFTTACNGGNGGSSSSQAQSGQEETSWTDGSAVGEGSTQFAFTVVDGEGNETHLEIHTDKETVGEALEELGVIAGDRSEYGLYVKTVIGITADYDKDGKYWAFYVNDEYAVSGVDTTPIAEGESYSFKME